MKKLFGTDGVRGRANAYPMTGDIAFKLGQATAVKFRNRHRSKIIIGKDTRRSGYVFEYALTAGLCSMGADVYLVGPVPTPAIAHLVKSFAADAGIMITASHNPAGDNGIKFFSSEGLKLPDKLEEDIERMVFSDIETASMKIEDIGRANRIEDASGRYIEFTKGTISNQSLAGLKVVLDCANGASYRVAPLIFSELGADVITYGNKPDGLNINKECGALHLEHLQAAVLGNEADVGIAFDGDADRLLMVDEKGSEFNGDRIMATIATDMKNSGRLKKDTLVATQYSNLGLDEAMNKAGIRVVRVDNGDRYVIEKLLEIGGNFGGEITGHIINIDKISTGDGILTGLCMLKILKDKKVKLSHFQSIISDYPQVLESFLVREKKPFDQMPKVGDSIEQAEKSFGRNGRIFVRYSGTENKCRVLAEGKDESLTKKNIKNVVKAIKEEIG